MYGDKVVVITIRIIPLIKRSLPKRTIIKINTIGMNPSTRPS